MRGPLGALLAVSIAFCAAASVSDGAGEGRFTARGTVTYVVDGDTLNVRLDGGRRERVRLIGIDTPERGECFSRKATATASGLARGKRVTLIGDRTQDTRDRYTRLLVYVWLPRGRDLGFQLVIRGLARVYVYERAFVRLDPYRYAERVARRLDRNVWRGCAAARRSPRCDASYPDVCIPPPPPDLECGDVRYRNFRVVGRDPHRFDGNRDGRGCEG